MNCHSSVKLDKLVIEKKKVRITFFDGTIYEGWLIFPFTGYGYILKSPDRDCDLRFCKSHVKKIEEAEE